MLGTKETNQPRTTHFWEYLITALIVGLLITYLAGYWSLPTSGHVSAAQVWLWSLVQWSLGIAAVLSAVSVAWYAPQLWGKRRIALANQEAELSMVGQRVKRGDLEIESLRADIVAKFAAIRNEQQRTQAELRQMAVHVESLTANKSTLLIDSSQANWQQSAVLLTHPKEAPTSSATQESAKPLRLIEDVLLKEPRFLLIGGTEAGKTNTTKHYLSALRSKAQRSPLLTRTRLPNCLVLTVSARASTLNR